MKMFGYLGWVVQLVFRISAYMRNISIHRFLPKGSCQQSTTFVVLIVKFVGQVSKFTFCACVLKLLIVPKPGGPPSVYI